MTAPLECNVSCEVNMMGDVTKFHLRKRPTREQARQWLSAYITTFPTGLDGGIGPALFHGWRFVLADDGCIYFANFLEPGINEREFQQARISN
jgi:hypothetical protein